MATYYVYILGSRSHRLYIGVTGNLVRRLAEHRQKLSSGFTAKYDIVRLLYFEATPNVSSAIAREKQIKGWSRRKKLSLIATVNPRMLDLTDMIFGKAGIPRRCAPRDDRSP